MAEDYKVGKVFAMYSDGHAVKVGTVEKDAKWYDVADDIQKYVDKSYKLVGVRYKERAKGKRREIFALFKQNEEKATPPEETKKPESSTGFTCETCGKELKDDKYKTCYTCNQKKPKGKPKKEERSNEYWDAKNEIIGKQGALKIAAIAIQKLEGNVADLETLEQQVIMLAEKFNNWSKGIV